MVYFFIFINILIVFLQNIGVDIQKKEKVNIGVTYSFFKIKISNKKVEQLLDFKSQNLQEDIKRFKESLKLKPLITNILSKTVAKKIYISYHDDVENLNLSKALLYSSMYEALSMLSKETFLFTKDEHYYYYPAGKKELFFDIRLRINLATVVIIILEYMLKKLGGKIYDKSRRLFKS